MKNVAIMQPYLFPYLGYFQLIANADIFVFHDDVQYIKGGWVNRNRLLIANEPEYFTFPVSKDHFSKNINERSYLDPVDAGRRLKGILLTWYKSARFRKDVLDLVEEITSTSSRNVAELNALLVKSVCKYLGIQTEIISSSSMGIAPDLQGAERVKEIVRILKGTIYTNPIGGKELYSRDDFAASGVSLRFLRAKLNVYDQNRDTFVPGLSILDVIAFNGLEKTRDMMGEFVFE